jgi:hypothetical protein
MDQGASLNLNVSSNSSYFDSLIRHCNILLTIAGLSFGLVPLQSAVLSSSSNNARSIGLALVAANFFVRGYTLSLHLSSANDSAKAVLHESAIADRVADNRGPPGFELNDEEREEDYEDGFGKESDSTIDSHDHTRETLPSRINNIENTKTRHVFSASSITHDIHLPISTQEEQNKIDVKEEGEQIQSDTGVITAAASRLVFVPPFTHPVTGIVVPGGWLDEQQLRRALVQHSSFEKSYISLVVSTCLERWTCGFCTPLGLVNSTTYTTTSICSSQLSQIISSLQTIIQDSPLLSFVTIMSLFLSLCMPAAIGAALGSFFLYQPSLIPSQISHQAALSVGIITLAVATIVHASEQDIRFLRLLWRRRIFSMPLIWRHSRNLNEFKREFSLSNTFNIASNTVEKESRRNVRLNQHQHSQTRVHNPPRQGKERIAIQGIVIRQLIFCLLAPALLVSGLKVAAITSYTTSSTPSSLFLYTADTLDIGISTSVLLITLFIPLIIPIAVTQLYQSLGLVAMPYLCSQKWMLWLLEVLQASLQTAALILLLAPSNILGRGDLISGVGTGTFCCAIALLVSTSFIVAFLSILFNQCFPTYTTKTLQKTKLNQKVSSTTSSSSSFSSSSHPSLLHGPKKTETLLSKSDMIFSIFSLSGRSLSSGLAIAYALSPVFQTPPFQLSNIFRTSLLLDDLLSIRAGIALSFSFYVLIQFVLFYLTDEILRAITFVNRLKEMHSLAERNALEEIDSLNHSSTFFSSSSSSSTSSSSSSSSSPSSSLTPQHQPLSSSLLSSESHIGRSKQFIQGEGISSEKRVKILADLVRKMQSPVQGKQFYQPQQQQQLPLPSLSSFEIGGNVLSSSSTHQTRHDAFPSTSSSTQHWQKNSSPSLDVINRNNYNTDENDKQVSNVISPNAVGAGVNIGRLYHRQSRPINNVKIHSTDVINDNVIDNQDVLVSTRFNKMQNLEMNNHTSEIDSFKPVVTLHTQSMNSETPIEIEKGNLEDISSETKNMTEKLDNPTHPPLRQHESDEGEIEQEALIESKKVVQQETPILSQIASNKVTTDIAMKIPSVIRSNQSVPLYAAVPDPSGLAPFILVAIDDTNNNEKDLENDLNVSTSTTASSFVSRLDSAVSTRAVAPLSPKRRPIARETLSR